MADNFIRIIEDESLNGACVEMAEGRVPVNILRHPHIEGLPTKRTMAQIDNLRGLKETLTPDFVSTKVDRSKINLIGKVALLTGASRKDGIGYNVAAVLCELGYACGYLIFETS